MLTPGHGPIAVPSTFLSLSPVHSCLLPASPSCACSSVTTISNHCDAYPDLQDIDRQLAAAETLFPPSIKDKDRQNGFQTAFLRIWKELPDSQQIICSHLNVLPRNLIKHYKKVEAMLPHSINMPTPKDEGEDDDEDAIHATFEQIFTSSQRLEFILAFIPDVL
ncbi:hypothetical protein BS47DRAFT_1396775 [Hydnum rufescens UP504]|uniref:Uncharacterized protein n=1 Tax=Hydnum rufescens UP504 TaxID=1448309 RepID=A0A9P6APF2_9AGAM|nr:hypothetical protein BS47DRAFT_1396775 [Hydnum rufescens UP504]